MTLEKVKSVRSLQNFVSNNRSRFPFVVQGHKNGTVTLLYVPKIDNRIPANYFDKNALKPEGRAFIEKQMPHLHGLGRVSIDEAKAHLAMAEIK